MTQQLNIGLIGFGNIGTGVVNALARNAELLTERTGVQARITRIADVDIIRARDAQYDPAILTTDANDLLSDPDIHVIIELVGGLEPARTFVEKALRSGKHVVTANKAMLATFGAELFAAAEEGNAALFFEASVGGGIPIIRALELGLTANRVRTVAGILNGTCNYILTHMASQHKAFDTMLAEAQAHGYAEPDPTYDIEGYDTAHKIAVLASLAFGHDIRFTDVFVEGITRMKQVDFEYAAELGFAIKLLGIAKADDAGRVEVRVHPTLLPRHSLLAGVDGVYNAVMVEGDLVGKTLFYGRGAGADPTSSAVLSDVAAIAASVGQGRKPDEHRLRVKKPGVKNLRPISELETAYYLRFAVADEPGVMAKLSGALGNHNISIRSMIQRGTAGSPAADVIIVTHKAVEHDVQAALADTAKMGITREEPFILRVEEDL